MSQYYAATVTVLIPCLKCFLPCTDIALVCVWFVLLVAGVITQAIVSKRRERKFYRQQQELGFSAYTRSSYQDFPERPYTQLREYLQRRRAFRGSPDEAKPLMSPSAINRGRYPSQ